MPPINVVQPSLPPFEEYADLIKIIWENRWLTHSGPLHEQLRDQLANYLQIPNVSLYTNGHQALEAAIHALKITGEVITTPYTFISTTHAITRNGLKPIFCDISYDDYNLDVSKIEGLITDKTSAIVPVHVYGTPCNVIEIERIAKQYDLKVVYDAAHAFGVEVHGRPITSYGDASMLSFHATKVFNTIEGGAVVSPNKDLTDYTDKYRRFGLDETEDYIEFGTNAKMNEFQAAMGLLNLKYIDQSIGSRKEVSDIYNEMLCEVPGIRLLPSRADVKANYAYYPILVEDAYPLTRDELYTRLAAHNIITKKYFYPLVTGYSCYSETYAAKDTPVAKQVSERVLTLPMYDTLNPVTARQIADLIRSSGE